jgi:hypothetical protein
MALSDNCAVALDELVNGVVDYGNLAYPTKDISKLIKAVYEISELIISYDASPNTPTIVKDTMVSNLVVNSFLTKLDNRNSSVITTKLARVAKRNIRFKNSIDEVFSSYSSVDETTLNKPYANIYKQLLVLQEKLKVNPSK